MTPAHCTRPSHQTPSTCSAVHADRPRPTLPSPRICHYTLLLADPPLPHAFTTHPPPPHLGLACLRRLRPSWQLRRRRLAPRRPMEPPPSPRPPLQRPRRVARRQARRTPSTTTRRPPAEQLRSSCGQLGRSICSASAGRGILMAAAPRLCSGAQQLLCGICFGLFLGSCSAPPMAPARAPCRTALCLAGRLARAGWPSGGAGCCSSHVHSMPRLVC